MYRERIIGALLALGIVMGGTAGVRAADAPAGSLAQATEPTPPRVSYIHGEVSFWRPGAGDWTRAEINTPLAPGDLLDTGPGGNVELQIGARAFVRAAEATRLGLSTHEPDLVQLTVTAGHASLDLRELAAGQTVELGTPNAAFTIERSGYYRVDVSQETTTFITRRGGRATLTPAGGTALAITPSEQVVIRGTETPRVETSVAPELSAWDRWNYGRTEQLIEALSARYVPPGIYGASDLDRHGSWRIVESYGPVWIPDGLPPGWAPYSTGRWIWDPRYRWTWVDNAPWGWAPYHYGRWAFVHGVWGWAPGPLVVRPVYAPALVVFLGGPVAPSRPLYWVALGWGEPVIPWWGRPGFVGAPWWGGWGGPRVVNNVVVNRNMVVSVQSITVYRNVAVTNAVVGVPSERFGRSPVTSARIGRLDVQGLAPVRGPLAVQPVAASLVPGAGTALRPAETARSRGVVATRAPQNVPTPFGAESPAAPPQTGQPPAPRLVPAPARPGPTITPARPPFGRDSAIERPRPLEPSRFEAAPHQEPRQESRRGDGRQPAVETARPARPSPPAQVPQPAAPPAPAPEPRHAQPAPPAGQMRSASAPEPRPAPPALPSQAARPPAPAPHPSPARAERVERAERPPRPLPGEPANRVSPGLVEMRPLGDEAQGRAMPGRIPGTGSPRGSRQ